MQEALIKKLQRLNKSSIDRAFTIDDMNWQTPVDRSVKWAPDHMVSINYIPSCKLLTKQQRLRYNQLFSMSICEQFVWLENNLLADVLIDAMKKTNLSSELKTGLENFYNEEEKHGEMFWRTLEVAEPKWYLGDREFKIFKTNKIQDAFFATICKYPDTLLVWIWMALFFEERTLDYSKQYQKAYKGSVGNIDFNFWQVHYYHMLDEVRHQQMDEVFLESFYLNASPWKRRLCGAMFDKIIKAYIAPKRNARVMLTLLGEEFPELKTHIIPKLKSELPTLRHNNEFQEMAFGRHAIGRTLELMARYNEFDPVWSHLLNETKSMHINKNRYAHEEESKEQEKRDTITRRAENPRL